jgi:hypothetical protein
MMKKWLIIPVLFLHGASLHGALSASSQSIREIKEILNSSFINENLTQSHPIEDISLIEEGEGYRVYALKSGDQILKATLAYKPTLNCGPRKYEIQWSNQ